MAPCYAGAVTAEPAAVERRSAERAAEMSSKSPSTQQHQRLVGIALMIAAVACFACLDTAAKWANQSLNPIQTAAVRYLGSFVLVAVCLAPWRRPQVLRSGSLRLQGARALFLALATLCSFLALHYLRLTQATSIAFASPLVVALLAGPMLGERIGLRRLLIVLLGFAGVLVITRPGSGEFHWAMLLSLVTAGANALYALTTRLLAGRDSSATTLFYTGLVGSILFLPALPLVWSSPGSALVWLALAGTAGFGALGHWLLILAHRHTPASVLAPFFYVQLLWAACLGFLVFGDLPDRWTLLGGAVVMSSGLLLLQQERAGTRGAG